MNAFYTQSGCLQLSLSALVLLVQNFKVIHLSELKAFSVFSEHVYSPGHMHGLLDSQECGGTYQDSYYSKLLIVPAFPLVSWATAVCSTVIPFPQAAMSKTW
jgi:hypothetical protein